MRSSKPAAESTSLTRQTAGYHGKLLIDSLIVILLKAFLFQLLVFSFQQIKERDKSNGSITSLSET